eukprot:9795149-Heterocapsa_arctica.AAC.1
MTWMLGRLCNVACGSVGSFTGDRTGTLGPVPAASCKARAATWSWRTSASMHKEKHMPTYPYNLADIPVVSETDQCRFNA